MQSKLRKKPPELRFSGENMTEKELLKTPKFTVVQREFSHGPTAIIRHPGAVVILPLIDDERICLISNFRKAVDKSLLELPAGTLDPGESPFETARRELAEETGYTAGEISPMFDYFVSPGILDERMYSFLATDLTPGQANLMDDEEIETQIVSYEEALTWIKSGKIEDAKTIATLLFYEHFMKEK